MSSRLKRRGKSSTGVAAAAVVLALKIAVSIFVLSTPLMGVWVGSSLATYRGGSLWLPIAAGLLAFPLLPLGWEAVAEWRRRRKERQAERILTFWDRLLLRTFAVNFVFLSVLLWARPEAAFEALSTRGDWMLRGSQSSGATTARKLLFGAAGNLEWLYEWAHADTFEELAPEDANRVSGDVKPGELPEREQPKADEAPKPDEPEPKPEDPRPPAAEPRSWPFRASLHEAARALSPERETSVEAVARALVSGRDDPFERVKALHDWVADRIAYDAPAYVERRFPPQDAASVFDRRTAVCAGYAQLFVALARAAGETAVYVTGDARVDDDELDGASHAWNAVKIEGRWYLLDATWDAGFVTGRSFEKRYSTVYFLTPPEVFGVDHFPDSAQWQLRDRALSRGEFMRQPMLEPAFFARGMRLERPDRSQVEVEGDFEIVISNPRGQHLLTKLGRKGADLDQHCEITPGAVLRARCPLSSSGLWEVQLFANEEQYGSFQSVGTLQAVKR